MNITVHKSAARITTEVTTETGTQRWEFQTPRQFKDACELIVNAWCRANGYKPLYDTEGLNR